MASSAERAARTLRFLVRMRVPDGRCATQGADSFPAGSLKLSRRRANIEICSFFCSRTKLTRESLENSCASGQTWYRNGTEVVLTGRKLYVACTKSVLVGIESAKLARSSTGKRVRHAVPLQLLDKLSVVASWGAASSAPTAPRQIKHRGKLGRSLPAAGRGPSNRRCRFS